MNFGLRRHSSAHQEHKVTFFWFGRRFLAALLMVAFGGLSPAAAHVKIGLYLPMTGAAAAMEAIEDGTKLPLDKALEFEAGLFGRICESEDMKEGVGAFLEKRQPKFQDK